MYTKYRERRPIPVPTIERERESRPIHVHPIERVGLYLYTQ